MNPIFIGAILALALVLGILLLLVVGRRVGATQITAEGEAAAKGLGAIEGAMFGLLGLILAFSFSGALARFDARRHLVVQETNTIGTAWLRIDLLPAPARAPIRNLFLRYLDARIEVYQKIPDMAAAQIALARSGALQQEIWDASLAATRDSNANAAPILLLPALNAMFDITTTRTEAARLHPPPVIFAMLAALTLCCSLFAGYDMAIRKRLNPLHSVGFALVLAITVYVIIDLEYPRMGLIRMTDSDAALVDLRSRLQPPPDDSATDGAR